MQLKGKTITFIGLNYAPEDTAIGLYSTQMVQALSEAGAHVNVVTAMPYYPQWKIQAPYDKSANYVKEIQRDIAVYRYKQYVPSTPTFLKRIVHILSFTYGSWRNLKKIDQSDLVISIIPFTTSAYLGNLHAKKHKAPHWVHIQDFEFDAALQSGVSGSGKKNIFQQLFKIEGAIFKKATAVSTISHLMVKKLQLKTNTPSFYLPNWIEPKRFEDIKPNRHRFFSEGKFQLLYSGNIGDKQDWEFFSAFAKALPTQLYDIVIVGDGSKKQWLQANVKQENIYYHNPIPYTDLPQLLCSADAHFLFQKNQVIDTVMPSKLLGMMASGKPSLIIGNPASEVRNVIEDSHGGVYLTGNHVDQALTTVEEWRVDVELRNHLGAQAKSYVLQNFSKTQILTKWIDNLQTMLA